MAHDTVQSHAAVRRDQKRRAAAQSKRSHLLKIDNADDYGLAPDDVALEWMRRRWPSMTLGEINSLRQRRGEYGRPKWEPTLDEIWGPQHPDGNRYGGGAAERERELRDVSGFGRNRSRGAGKAREDLATPYIVPTVSVAGVFKRDPEDAEPWPEPSDSSRRKTKKRRKA